MTDTPLDTNQLLSDAQVDDADYYATYFPDPSQTSQEQGTSPSEAIMVMTRNIIQTPIDTVVVETDNIDHSTTTSEITPVSHESLAIEGSFVAPLLTDIPIVTESPQATTVQLAYEQVGEDTKFVRLTTITTIVHSIIFLCYIGFNGLHFMPKSASGDDATMTLLNDVMAFFTQGNIPRGILAAIGLILAIGYFILPPIGEAAMIFYLGNDEKRGSISLAKGFGKFFPMFEYNGMISFFTLLPYFVIVSRFVMLHLISNVFVIIILFLRGLLVLFAYIFLPFTKFYIVQENLQPLAAMKKSMQLGLENFSTVVRYTFLQYALSIRFIINIVLFLGMPVLILYTASAFDITAPGLIGTVIIVVTIGVALLIAYVNGIIEAFFMTLRYRLFQQLK